MINSSAKPEYNESSIRVLKGLDAVRQVPGMYTDDSSPLHIIEEVIANAVDEALAGYASRIDVVCETDGSISVKDNGRGIPVGPHPEEKIPVVTLAFTTLHAGGKFDKAKGGAYSFSGGLHGVGVAVTTALSDRVRVKVRREGFVYEVEYVDGGREIGEVKKLGACDKSDTGTEVRVWPKPSLFTSPVVSIPSLRTTLQSKAALASGFITSLTVDGQTTTWSYAGGLEQYLMELSEGKESVAPLFSGSKFFAAQSLDESEENEQGVNEGEGAAYALGWFPEGGVPSLSFVNMIHTPNGGTHESGLRSGVFQAVKNFIEQRGLLPRGTTLIQDDVVRRMTFILSARVLDAKFEGQKKVQLYSRNATKLVMKALKDPLEIWLNNNLIAGKAIAEMVIRNALAREKNGKQAEKKKSSGITVLPGKLSDCELRQNNEIFIVEGDSAGGSAKEARNRATQAILPLRGKVLNTYEVARDRLFANTEIHDLSVATGVEPHSLDDDPAVVLANLRYVKIMIMTDADVDGAHIRVLLITAFLIHFPHLITQGHVWIVQSPLYRIDVAPVGKQKQIKRLYVLDQAEHDKVMAGLKKDGVKQNRISAQRFKGLGEMNAEQLEETSMDPNTRSVYRLVLDTNEIASVMEAFDLMMSKGRADSRKEWLAQDGATIDADI